MINEKFVVDLEMIKKNICFILNIDLSTDESKE